LVTDISTFYSLPRRIFLDSNVLQTLLDYGGFIWEGGALPGSAKVLNDRSGLVKLEALRAIMFVNQRAGFEFALSERVLTRFGTAGTLSICSGLTMYSIIGRHASKSRMV